MVPLPDCASGEWGPTKATRLFGLIPITHQVKNNNKKIQIIYRLIEPFNYIIGTSNIFRSVN